VKKNLAWLLFIPAIASANIQQHHDANGQPVSVYVFNNDCPSIPGRSCSFANLVYLAGLPTRLTHELAHVAGMRHTAWKRNGFGMECATVTDAGYATGYRKGDVICGGFDGSDIIERSSK